MITLCFLGNVLISATLIWIVQNLFKKYNSKNKFDYETFMRIPGPRPLPLIGNALHFAMPHEKLYGYWTTLKKKYGLRFRMFGLDPIVIISEPEDIKGIITIYR